MGWQVYIIECADGTFYTGVTDDMDKRLEAHRQGRGARYTRGRCPLAVVYQEACCDRSAAQKREAAIKKLSRLQKKCLIEGFLGKGR